MKKMLLLLLAALTLTTSVFALEIPDSVREYLPHELTQSVEREDSLLLGGWSYLCDTVRSALFEILRSGVRSCAMLMLLAAVDEASALCAELLELTRLSPTLFVPLVKVMAVAVTVRLTAALCKDAGQSALAALTEIAGTVCALWCALPLLRAVVELLEGWI